MTGTEKENFGSELYEETDKKSNKPHSNGVGNRSQGTELSEGEMQKNDETNGIDGNCENFWKQEEQQSLEIALKKFPKDTPGRWEKIAEFISTKSKVVSHFL